MSVRYKDANVMLAVAKDDGVALMTEARYAQLCADNRSMGRGIPLVLSPNCVDCHGAETAVTYGMGARRCRPCSDLFSADRHAAELAKIERQIARINALPPCDDCGGRQTLDSMDEPVCQSCCDHERDADEGFMCMLCDAEWEG